MAASLFDSLFSRRRHDGLQPMRAGRDLYQIAELVETCFSDRLDEGGRSAIREMKTLSMMAPVLWLVNTLDPAGSGIGTGCVWREDGRVVGNASLYPSGRHPWLGRGALIANVGVLPEFRRRGIARAVTTAAMDRARATGAQWIALQVEEQNTGAITLYDDLGFTRYETLTHWEALSHQVMRVQPADPVWRIRSRHPAEVHAESDLIFRRARVGGMAWTRTIEQGDLRQSYIPELDALFAEGYRRHMVLPDPGAAHRLLAAAWVETAGYSHARLTVFLDPILASTDGPQILLSTILWGPGMEGRRLRLEVDKQDDRLEDWLMLSGFRKVRSLIQMRYAVC